MNKNLYSLYFIIKNVFNCIGYVFYDIFVYLSLWNIYLYMMVVGKKK